MKNLIKESLKDSIKPIVILLTVCFFLWIVGSYIAILTQNLDYDTPTKLASGNFFSVMEKIFAH